MRNRRSPARLRRATSRGKGTGRSPNAEPPETRAPASRRLARQRNWKKPQRGTAGDPRFCVAPSRAAKEPEETPMRNRRSPARPRRVVSRGKGTGRNPNAEPPETRAPASRRLARQRNWKKPQCGTAGAPRVRVAEPRAAKSFKAAPHNSAARRAKSFPPSAACKFLDLPPVNLRNLHLHLTKNPFAGRPPHLCGVALNNRQCETAGNPRPSRRSPAV